MDALAPAVASYRDRVDAVLAQRTRLRGPEPPGDLFAGLPPQSPLFSADPHGEPDATLAALLSYVQPDDVVTDIGGGGGRVSLPLALRCREVVNVEPSARMVAAFEENARRHGVANARAIHSSWPMADPPRGTVALVNSVLYLTRDVGEFVRALDAAASRRVLVTAVETPTPSSQAELFRRVHGEEEVPVPGYRELVAVVRELGHEPEVRPLGEWPPWTAPTREAAVQAGIARFGIAQWAMWPLGDELTARLRRVLEDQFDELFEPTEAGYLSRWVAPRRDMLVTWTPRRG